MLLVGLIRLSLMQFINVENRFSISSENFWIISKFKLTNHVKWVLIKGKKKKTKMAGKVNIPQWNSVGVK